MSSKFDPRWRVMKNQPHILCQSEIKDEIFRMKNRFIPIFYSERMKTFTLTTNAIPNICSSFFSLLATARFQIDDVQ